MACGLSRTRPTGALPPSFVLAPPCWLVSLPTYGLASRTARLHAPPTPHHHTTHHIIHTRRPTADGRPPILHASPAPYTTSLSLQNALGVWLYRIPPSSLLSLPPYPPLACQQEIQAKHIRHESAIPQMPPSPSPPTSSDALAHTRPTHDPHPQISPSHPHPHNPHTLLSLSLSLTPFHTTCPPHTHPHTLFPPPLPGKGL